MQKIKQGELSKIVLANERCFKTAAPLAATDLLAESEKYNLGCYHFMLAESEQRAFIGSSPELLYRRHGLQLKTEALAGTAFMGKMNNKINSKVIGCCTTRKTNMKINWLWMAFVKIYSPLCNKLR